MVQNLPTARTSRNETRVKKTVIVGAGIGGLATALRLQLNGHHVLVIEQGAQAGGKLNEFTHAGFRFDAGPSLFTLPALIEELLELANEAPSRFPYIKLDRSCHYFWNDHTHLIAWADRERFAAEIESKLGVSAQPALKHLEKSAFLYEKTAKLFMERSLHRFKSYLSRDVLGALFNVHRLNLLTTMHKANEAALNHPKLVQLFNRYATYNGSDPYRAPGVLHIIPHLEHNIGTFFPKHGMYQITQVIAQLAEEKGVEFHFNTKATSIRVENKQCLGVETQQGFFAADEVVSNADVFSTYRFLLPNEKAPERILKRERSSSALIFYWGINREFDQLDLHNIFFSDDYAGEFKLLFEGEHLHPDPTVYINITSKYNKTDAPSGSENWFVMINVPANRGQDWSAWIPKAREIIVKKVSAILKADVARHIVCEEILDPAGIESKTSSHMGSLYGTSSNDAMAAFLRHPNFAQSIKGLYFCGGSVHPGGGIPLCLLSAKIVSELIEGDS
jgi:phytoene desaturase